MVDGGCTWQDLLPLHLLLWQGGEGALGKAFFPFSCCCGIGVVGGGAKRSTSESDHYTCFFFTSLLGGEAKRGLERRSNPSLLDTCFNHKAKQGYSGILRSPTLSMSAKAQQMPQKHRALH